MMLTDDEKRALIARLHARRTVAILDDDDQDPPGVHHGHAGRQSRRSADVIPFRKYIGRE
jgi:hypothetical protein